MATSQHEHTWSAKDDVEVHAIDADVGIVFDSQINVFLDAEAEVAGVRKVAFSQLVFSDL